MRWWWWGGEGPVLFHKTMVFTLHYKIYILAFLYVSLVLLRTKNKILYALDEPGTKICNAVTVTMMCSENDLFR